MNKNKISVLEFYLKGSLRTTVVLCLVMAAVEIFLFKTRYYGIMSFDEYVEYLKLHLVFCITVLLNVAYYTSSKSRVFMPQNAVNMLRVEEKTAFRLSVLSHIMQLIIICGVQIALLIGFAQIFPAMTDGVITRLGVTVDFYRNDFIHGLLPIADVSIWIRNIIFLISIAVMTALMDLSRRKAERHLFGIVLTLFILFRTLAVDISSASMANYIYVGFILIMGSLSYYLAMSMCDRDESEGGKNENSVF